MSIFKIPFNVVNGFATKHESGSIEAYAQIVTAVIKTNRQELPLEPTFGISDITFEPDNVYQAIPVLRQFWPEIQVKNIELSSTSNSGVVNIKFGIGGN